MLPEWIKLNQQENGAVTLAVAPGKNDGSVQASQVALAIGDMNSHGFFIDLNLIEKALTGKGGFQGSVMYPRNATIEFDVSADQMTATGVLIPAMGGVTPSAGELMAALQDKGLKVGLKEEVISNMLADQLYEMPTLIAEGIPPVMPVDGSAEVLFGPKKTTEDIGLERVDYRAGGGIASVAQNEAILKVTHPQEGQPGQTVTGHAISVPRPKPVKLRLGKNTRYSDETQTLVLSDIEGVPSFKSGLIEVNPLLEVGGDIDFSVGNMNFHGALHIRGSVLPGFCIQSTGDIVIDGIVDSARVESTGGNVVIRGGVAGHNKTVVQAAGDVQALYVDKATVLAEGNVVVDESVLHSTLMAFGNVTVTAKRGQIIGGVTRCGGTLTVNDLGAVAHPATTVQVGGNPKIHMEQESIQGALSELTKMVEDQEKNVATMEKQVKEGVSVEQKKKVLGESKVALQQSQHRVTEYMSRLKLLEDRLQGVEKHMPKVVVMKVAYPGVNISIKNATYKVLRESDHMQFVNLNGEVAMQPV